jgi:hypothetical protein
MDPPTALKTSQIKPVDDMGPGIAVRTVEARMWGRIEFSTATVVVTAANGVRWEIDAWSEDPSKWRAYRIEPGKEPQQIPFGPLAIEDTHRTTSAK